MGELFVKIKLPKREEKKIEPIERRLVRMEEEDDQDWGNWRSLSLEHIIRHERGGLILGEGDSGKSTYVKMLAERAKNAIPRRNVELLRLARDSVYAEHIQKAIEELHRRDILILDGLDEKQKLVHDIAEICNNRHNCAIWITSRPCDAATYLQGECDLFEKPFRLSDFTLDDVSCIARSLGVDANRFIKALRSTGLESFTAKPGGTVLMLCKYLNGKISHKGRVAAMEELLEDFSRTNRDGKIVRQLPSSATIKEIAEAVRWMAATLFLSGKNSIWIGEPECEPDSALPFDRLPFDRHSRETCFAALERRLFEPLSVGHLRLTYADMLPYLAGSYIARELGADILSKIIPMEGDHLSKECAEVISWMGQIEPKLCLPWIEKRPLDFAHCHEAIEMIGVEKYFQFVSSSLRQPRVRVFNNTNDRTAGKRFDGLQSLLDFCIDRLKSDGVEVFSNKFTAIRLILDDYSEGWVLAIRALLSRNDFLTDKGYLNYSLFNHLGYYIAQELRLRDTLPSDIVEQLLSFLRDENRSGKMNCEKARLLRSIYPKCISKETLAIFLKEPFKIPPRGAYARTIVRLLKDAGLDWYREQIPDEKQLWDFSCNGTVRSRVLPEYYVRVICNIAKKNKPRAIQSLIRIGDKFAHGEFNKILNVLGPYFALDILKEMVMPGGNKNIRKELVMTCLRCVDRDMDADLFEKFCSDLTPWSRYTNLEYEIIKLKENYLERTNKPKLSMSDISKLTQIDETPKSTPATTDDVLRIVKNAIVPEIKQLQEDHEKQNRLAADVVAEIKAENAKSRKKLEDKIKVPRPELTQEMVAKDFGVSRKTVNEWETRQTIDGPDNKSNKFGYYKSLRANPDLRGAYDQLVQVVQMYKKVCENAKKLGRRSITFVTFNEKFHALKVKSLSSLQV